MVREYKGEPKDVDELLLRARLCRQFRFIPRRKEPRKNPKTVLNRLALSRLDAELIIASLKKSECISPKEGTACDDPRIPCQRMWAFKHAFHPMVGDGPRNLYIKLSSVLVRDENTGEEETIIVFVISFHEDA